MPEDGAAYLSREPVHAARQRNRIDYPKVFTLIPITDM